MRDAARNVSLWSPVAIEQDCLSTAALFCNVPILWKIVITCRKYAAALAIVSTLKAENCHIQDGGSPALSPTCLKQRQRSPEVVECLAYVA